MKCPGCSEEVSGKFCKYCGYDLTKAETPTVIRLGEEP